MVVLRVAKAFSIHSDWALKSEFYRISNQIDKNLFESILVLVYCNTSKRIAEVDGNTFALSLKPE